MAKRWPLIGRDQERRFIDGAILGTGGPGGIVLAGAAGVGKTRLAQETLETLQQAGVSTRWATGTSASRPLPFGALAPHLGEFAGNPMQMLRRAADALLGSDHQGDVALFVDDAHLLDDLSAVLLLQLVVQRQARLVITIRSGADIPDALAAVWTQDHLPRLDIQPLSDTETNSLLEAVLEAPLEESGRRRLCALTRGNVLYLHQVVDGERAAGRLRKVRGGWHWSGAFEPSAALADLIGSRLQQVSEPLSRVVDLLATAEQLPLPVLTRLCDPRDVEEAENAGLVQTFEASDQMQVRLGHPLFGEVRRAHLGRLKTKRLCGDIASTLAEAPNPGPGDILRLASLTLASDLEPEPALLTAAANRALQLCDFDLAERMSRAAVGAGAGFGAQLLLAFALSFGGRGEEAQSLLTQLSSEAADPQDRLAVTLPQVANAFFLCGRPDQARTVLNEAYTWVPDESRSQLSAMHSMVEACSGHPADGVQLARRAFEEAEDLPPIARLTASWGLVAGMGVIGHVDTVRATAITEYNTAKDSYELGQPRLGFADYYILGLLLAGHIRDAELMAQTAAREVDEGLTRPRAMVSTILSKVALAQGRPHTCRAMASAALEVLDGHDTGGWVYGCLIYLATSNALLGDSAAAAAAAARLEAERHPAHSTLEPDALLARAFVAACSGAISDAITHARDAAQWAQVHGQYAHELVALHAAVRFGDDTASARVEELAGRVDGPRPAAAAAHAASLAAHDGDELLQASRMFEEFGDMLSAADASAQASLVYARQGKRGSSLTAAERARRLQATCEDAQTPALRAAVHPLPLTDREREIVTLAAHGLSNKDIADTLMVSVRTVEGHLYRATTKLGVRGREELTTLLLG